MNKLKVGKSNSTLWRQAKSNVVRTLSSSADVESDDCQRSFLAESVDDVVIRCDVDQNLDIEPLLFECFPNYIGYNSSLNSKDDFELGIGERWFCDDSEDSDSDLEVSEHSVAHDVAQWAVEYHITISAIRALLAILKPHMPGLPRDPRTLLKTPTQHTVKVISGGHYSHVGLSKGLTRLVTSNSVAVDCLEIQINVDGLPLFKSTNTSLWPILCSVKNLYSKEPFVVGVFCGKEKPGDAAEFMSEFVAEATHLLANGLEVDNKKYPVSIHSFVCDAPARAFLKGIKSHSGYASCEKCTVHGVYDGKVIFPADSAPLRTDETFNAMDDEDHHTEPCPLNPLPIGYVTQFGLDYMHLACLGVMRRLLLYWKGPVGPLRVRLGRKCICDLSTRLLRLSTHVPVEFARRPRTVDDILRWKATEFREFMLYTGPAVLKDILPDRLYDHFMLFFVAMRLLASPVQSSDCHDYANSLLEKFVCDAEILYGREMLVYNVHSLLHLASDVKRLGCLDDFSAFVFENKLGQLKKLIRKPQQPLQQLLRRLDEQGIFIVHVPRSYVQPKLKLEHFLGPSLPQFISSQQFTYVNTGRWNLSIKPGDNCVIIKDGSPAVIKNILKTGNEIYLICSNFVTVGEAFTSPLKSTKLNICKVGGETGSLFGVPLADVLYKCACCPASSNSFLIVPLLH